MPSDRRPDETMPAGDARQAVTLMVGGREHRDWTSYEVDSDLMTPADAWRVTLGIPADAVPATVRPWEPVQLAVGGEVVLSGRIDRVERTIRKGELSLAISGRDGAAVLVDCSAPIFTSRQVSVAEAVAHIVRPLGIAQVRVAPGAGHATRHTAGHEKVAIEPGMTAWDALQQVAEANGMWPWFTPDGTLVVGGPDYTAPPVGGLVLRMDGTQNNVLALSVRDGVEERFSEVTVLGQSHGTEEAEGANALRAIARDTTAQWHRPRVVVEAECDTADMARRRARKLLADGRLAAFEMRATVRGHRASGPTGDGVLWQPGQRVRVLSEPHGIDGVFFLTRRTFMGGRDRGQVTELTLKEDGVWLPDVGKRRKRKKQDGETAMEVVDL